MDQRADTTDEQLLGGTPGHRLSRRQFLAAGALTMGVAAAGCSSTGIGSKLQNTGTGSVPGRKGGTLRVGLTGGSTTDTLNAFSPVSSTDVARILQLYDQLATLDPDAQPVLALAEEMTPNRDSTSWIIRLRPDLTFHNGKAVSADDLLFSLRVILNPTKSLNAAPLSRIDPASLAKVDSRTVRVDCHSPFSTLVETLAGFPAGYGIVPEGYDPANPVGTGPFVFKSFTPGQQSVFTRNENYWMPSLPYVDELVLIDFADESSQLNALLSGQVDLIDWVSPASFGEIRSAGGNIVISDSGGIIPFTMRVDQRPFSDVRVRRALRLLVDRPQMMEVASSGYGVLGNDVFGIWDADYDHTLPQRTQDISQAKYLLHQAGYDNLSVQLVTAPIVQGATSAATVFAQQASPAGVKVSLDSVTVNQLYGPSYLSWTFAQDYFYYTPYLPLVSETLLPGGGLNETHWADPAYTTLYNQALSTNNAATRKAIVHDMQAIDYDSGGLIIPYFPALFDGVGAHVKGVESAKTGISLMTFDFKSFWLD